MSPAASVVERVKTEALRAVMSLPPRVQGVLAGRRVVVDGAPLAVDVQLMLRLQRMARERGAETMPIPDGRRAIRRHTRMSAGPRPLGEVRDLVVAGLPARLYSPPLARGGLLVFFHGGGFMYGDLESHDPACRFLAERSGAQVLAVDYRLGPEQPFPAAYDDAVAAYRWVVEHVDELGADPQRLAVGGDSAGGNLAIGVAVEAARTGLPLAFQLLVYPVTDAVRDTASASLFAEGFYLTRGFMDLAGASYIVDSDPRDPRVSPAYADLPAGLAPAYVATAGFDPLRDEGEAFARRLAESGAAVELRRYDDLIHGFLNVGLGRTAPAANAEIAAALRAGLAPP
ncbi:MULTISPECIES: alpha/beta hydrolase [unclassified Nocardioides]|uniref:alpha/beta hydrolase n=1 Tax=unclassified Nocardioides TaxID=2615069 RepID=UPI000B1FD997|nr:MULTISPECIES: alpha/beta hydrolase [unclassified Nocardioides]